jgi:hypothetical protein
MYEVSISEMLQGLMTLTNSSVAWDFSGALQFGWFIDIISYFFVIIADLWIPFFLTISHLSLGTA